MEMFWFNITWKKKNLEQLETETMKIHKKWTLNIQFLKDPELWKLNDSIYIATLTVAVNEVV